MATLVKEVYEALLDAGASKEKASEAAEAVAGFAKQTDVLTIQTNIVALRTDVEIVKADIKVLASEMKLVRWLVTGVGFSLVLLILQQFLS